MSNLSFELTFTIQVAGEVKRAHLVDTSIGTFSIWKELHAALLYQSVRTLGLGVISGSSKEEKCPHYICRTTWQSLQLANILRKCVR